MSLVIEDHSLSSEVFTSEPILWEEASPAFDADWESVSSIRHVWAERRRQQFMVEVTGHIGGVKLIDHVNAPVDFVEQVVADANEHLPVVLNVNKEEDKLFVNVSKSSCTYDGSFFQSCLVYSASRLLFLLLYDSLGNGSVIGFRNKLQSSECEETSRLSNATLLDLLFLLLYACMCSQLLVKFEKRYRSWSNRMLRLFYFIRQWIYLLLYTVSCCECPSVLLRLFGQCDLLSSESDRSRFYYIVVCQRIEGVECASNDPKGETTTPSRWRVKMDGCLGDSGASRDDGDGRKLQFIIPPSARVGAWCVFERFKGKEL